MDINFKEAFTFMCKDEKFVSKYLLGTLYVFFSVTPYIAFYEDFLAGDWVKGLVIAALQLWVLMFPIGYALLYANSKITTNTETLPEWDGNLSTTIENSFKYYMGCVLFMIPTGIVFTIIATIAGIIASIISVLLIGAANFTNPIMFNAAAGLTVLGTLIILLPVFLCLVFLFLMAKSSFLTDMKIISFLNFKKMFSLLKKNFLNLFLIFVLACVFGLCSHMLLNKFQYVYYVLASVFGFYFMLAFSNLFAQYVKVGLKKQLERIEAEKTEVKEAE